MSHTQESPTLWQWGGADMLDGLAELNRHDAFVRNTDQVNKADAGKTNPVLFERDLVNAINAVNRVLDYGAIKYEPGGWMSVDPSRYDSAARRHRRDRDKGELRDKESGLVHLAHEIINLMFQLEMFIRANPDMDFNNFNLPPTNHKEQANGSEAKGSTTVVRGSAPFNTKGVRNRVHAQSRSTERGKATTTTWL